MWNTCWNLLSNNFFLIFVIALSCPFPLQLRVSVSARKHGIRLYRYPTEGTISDTQLSHEYVNNYEFRGKPRDREQYTHIIHHKLHLDPSTNPLIHQYTHNLNSSRSIKFANSRNFPRLNSSSILMRCGIWQSLTRCENNHTNKI